MHLFPLCDLVSQQKFSKQSSHKNCILLEEDAHNLKVQQQQHAKDFQGHHQPSRQLLLSTSVEVQLEFGKYLHTVGKRPLFCTF